MTTILVVDNDAGRRRVDRIVLEYADHAVVEVASRSAAARWLKDAALDLVIVNVTMPDRDGIETIRTLRALGLDVPVLATSDSGCVERLECVDSALDVGADRTLAKPYRARELLAIVDDMLRQRWLQAASHTPVQPDRTGRPAASGHPAG